MSDFVLVARDGPVATITLNRPERRNAFADPEDCAALIGALRAADADAAIRAVILTGAGNAFCAGGDLRAMRDRTGIGAGETGFEIRETYRRGIQRIPLAFEELDMPVIAAVNGPAVGAGLDLALMCDIRIGSASAIFAENFVKIGIVPGDGGAWLLQRVVGYARAMEMSLTGDAVGAEEALALGIVSHITPPEALMAAARAVADRIAANPPGAVRMTKRLVREARAINLASLLDLSAAYQALAHGTADHRKALAAMLKRRTPRPAGK